MAPFFLKRGDLIIGVTTAATLWVITVIGLCFGGGQLGPGVVATLLGAITLWALNWLDIRIPRQQRAMLVIKADLASFSPAQLPNLIARAPPFLHDPNRVKLGQLWAYNVSCPIAISRHWEYRPALSP